MFYTEVQKTNNRSLEYGNEHGMALTRENREKRKKEKKKYHIHSKSVSPK